MSFSSKPVPTNRKRQRLIVSTILVAGIALVVIVYCFLPSRSQEPAPVPLSPQAPPRAVPKVPVASLATEPDLLNCKTTMERLQVMQEKLQHDNSLTPDARHQKIIEVLATSVNNSLESFAHLPSAQKKQQARLLQQDAEKTRDFFRRLPHSKQGKAVSLLMTSQEGMAQVNRAMAIVGNKLSPEDLALLGPTINIWASMLKGE